MASVLVASVSFSSSLSYRRRFRTRERRRRQKHTFSCSLTSCVAKNEQNDSGSSDDIEGVKFFLFLTHIFSELKSVRFCGGPLGTHGPRSKRFLGTILHLSNEFILDHITRNYLHITDGNDRRCHIALNDLKTLGTCDGYTREAVCDVVMSLNRRRCSGGRKR